MYKAPVEEIAFTLKHVAGLTKAIEYRGAYALALFQQIELQISKVFFQRLGAGLGDIACLLIANNGSR